MSNLNLLLPIKYQYILKSEDRLLFQYIEGMSPSDSTSVKGSVILRTAMTPTLIILKHLVSNKRS